MTSFLVTFLVALSLGVTASARYITCYLCSTTYLPSSQMAFNCNETFNSTGIATCIGLTCVKNMTNCTGSAAECWQSYSLSTGVLVMRSCSNVSVDQSQCSSGLERGEKAVDYRCTCRSDYCNGLNLDDCTTKCRRTNSTYCWQSCSTSKTVYSAIVTALAAALASLIVSAISRIF